MPVLNINYRHCSRMRPSFLKNAEIEALAAQIRQQLVDPDTDAISLQVLSSIDGLKINGVAFDLFVGTEGVVHDEDGNPVLGICEYDPGVPDTAMVSVSPASSPASEALVLSTLGHELGHAIFDAPSWIVDASKGPGLFDDPTEYGRKAYRTTTRDGEHLAKAAAGDVSAPARAGSSQLKSDEYFAELRANEFMGSLLVPRQRLTQRVEEQAAEYEVTLQRRPSLDPEWPGTSLTISADDENGLLELQRSLARCFGVNPRFIQVRMERYGLIISGAKIT